MNVKNFITVIASCVLFSCNNTTEQPPSGASELEEITPFIETRVMVCDTMELRNADEGYKPRTYMEERGYRFLSNSAFNALIKELKHTFNDPKSLIYYSPMPNESALSLKQRKEMALTCDSVDEFYLNTDDKMTRGKHWLCDSVSFWYNINSIFFYESWFYNKRTGEIVKKQLGYGVWQWVEEKQALRERYVYFTSKEAREIVLKNY